MTKSKIAAALSSVILGVSANAVIAGEIHDNFYQSPTVTVQKVTFKNLYKMDLVGNLFLPKGTTSQEALAAISW